MKQQAQGVCSDWSTYIKYIYKTVLPKLFRNAKHKTIFKNVISEKLRKQFCFLTCILPDYVAHESFKEFWKNGHFENMRADFFRRCQNSLWQTDDAFAGMIIFFTDIKYVVAFHPIKILTH